MNKSSIEITDQAYLIRLQKEEFDYVQVRQMLSLLMSLGRSAMDHPYIAEPEQLMPEEEDLRSRPASELGDRFDHLSDK